MPGVRSEISSFAKHCVDANVVLRVLTAPAHPAVAQLWSEFAVVGTEVIAPTLLPYELATALHQHWRASRLDPAGAQGLLDVAQALPIALHGDEQLHVRALELAIEHRLPATYDAHYLALAERFRVPLWTCDGRLAGAVRERLPWVHLVP